MAHTIYCAVCREPFTASRSDAETCSKACRDRRYRAKQVAEVARTVAVLEALAAAASLTPDD